ncbi:hypothetical protein B0A49_03366 [Cryomyces minteri]|uniref:Nudix hydrolase domain-containing protein n=1 Tax=Cryomyces minteri TaxID=331657 RepID=A0A4U0X8G7_9PEZI|nr:hypothetical protein B0A49_03366 [Cryomyces minteri]
MSDHDTQARPTSDLIRPLERVLRTLHANPFPDVANPPEVKKRASVAVILRVQPHYSHWPPRHAPDESFIDVAHAGSAEQRATAFFDQDWVKHGEPEVLLIRRAAREGDRWQSHVALPGGRRDPDDEGDKAAAIRETAEEVGIDLSDANCIAIGNLPQRVVTTSWGKVALMVLCPYVFLITQPSLPPLRLQPTEVASTHWVSLRALLSPSQRTFAYEDVSSRLAKQEKGWRKDVMRVMLGKMQFAAIRLIPSESSYCSTTPGFLPPAPNPTYGPP